MFWISFLLICYPSLHKISTSYKLKILLKDWIRRSIHNVLWISRLLKTLQFENLITEFENWAGLGESVFSHTKINVIREKYYTNYLEISVRHWDKLTSLTSSMLSVFPGAEKKKGVVAFDMTLVPTYRRFESAPEETKSCFIFLLQST